MIKRVLGGIIVKNLFFQRPFEKLLLSWKETTPGRLILERNDVEDLDIMRVIVCVMRTTSTEIPTRHDASQRQSSLDMMPPITRIVRHEIV